MFHAGRSLLRVEFRDFDTFSSPRRGCARFFTCPTNESAKRFAGDIEAGVGEPLPDLFVRFSGAQRDFDSKQKRTEENGLRPGLSPVMKEDHHRPVSGHVVVNRHNVETVLAQRGEEDMTPPCWIR